jgi:hypothetical protein
MIGEPEFGLKAEMVYREALGALDRAEVRYMLGGAVAVNAYTGIWRDTKDLDVFVPREIVARVLKTLEQAGFEVKVADPYWLAKAWKGDIFLDVVHANDSGTVAVEESWFTETREIEVLGHRAFVIPVEEMILSKMFVASRDRWDLSDVLHLIFATRGDLDWDRLIAGTGEHRELLLAYLHFYRYVYPSHAGYVPGRVFRSLLDSCEEEIESAPRRTLRFRGTMLDNVSFGVDVKVWGLPDERVTAREALRSSGEGR